LCANATRSSHPMSNWQTELNDPFLAKRFRTHCFREASMSCTSRSLVIRSSSCRICTNNETCTTWRQAEAISTLGILSSEGRMTRSRRTNGSPPSLQTQSITIPWCRLSTAHYCGMDASKSCSGLLPSTARYRDKKGQSSNLKSGQYSSDCKLTIQPF
jgi:hypothetical protein